MPRFALRRTALLFCLAFPFHSIARAAPLWRPIAPGEFAVAAPENDTAAGAIVLLREITVDDSDNYGTVLDYYIRIKVLSAAGAEALSKMEIPFERGRALKKLAARTVKPDGSSVELDAAEFHTRELVRVGREAVSVKAFSFPAVEPGCIVEYRYLVRTTDAIGGMRLYISDDFPVRLARFRIKPFRMSGFQMGMRVIWSPSAHVTEREKDRGFYVYECEDIPVVKPASLPPPPDVIRPWFIFYFTTIDGFADTYWSYVARDLVATGDHFIRSKKILKRKAEEITAGVASDQDKLQRIYDYCRTGIRNVSYDISGYTPDEVETLDENKSPADTLKHGYGTSFDINLLFAALTRSLGGQSELALCADRSVGFFTRDLLTSSALPRLLVAVRVGAGWQYFDPGQVYLPYGKLPWMHEDTQVLVATSKAWEFNLTKETPARESLTRRFAHLQLHDDGTIEGDVRIEMTGHEAFDLRHAYDAKTDDERLEAVRTELSERLGRCEVTALVVENMAEITEPLRFRYHIRAENYAEVTGERIFVAPSFFEKGRRPLFESAERAYGIYNPYNSRHEDVVRLDLPDTFQLEVPTSPVPHTVDKLFSYIPSLGAVPAKHRLVFRRNFTTDYHYYDRRAYPIIKNAYDHVHRNDAHVVTLRRTPGDATAAPDALLDLAEDYEDAASGE